MHVYIHSVYPSKCTRLRLNCQKLQLFSSQIDLICFCLQQKQQICNVSEMATRGNNSPYWENIKVLDLEVQTEIYYIMFTHNDVTKAGDIGNRKYRNSKTIGFVFDVIYGLCIDEAVYAHEMTFALIRRCACAAERSSCFHREWR